MDSASQLTFEQIRALYPNTRIVAIADGNNGLTLYAGKEPCDWPSDWPSSGITIDWLEDRGVEVLA